MLAGRIVFQQSLHILFRCFGVLFGCTVFVASPVQTSSWLPCRVRIRTARERKNKGPDCGNSPGLSETAFDDYLAFRVLTNCVCSSCAFKLIVLPALT